ncbi:MAG: aminocarboxymuconate-semialdehyde decarboxylase [Alphaproteobacteria bacterium]|nr:aminocarboxymuconate-semialdehyde decarboxylase [Alphaproteobacteria bacterium]
MADSWNKYADTAARKHGRPGRETRPKSTTIDIHTHISVPAATQYVQPHLRDGGDLLARFSPPETLAVQKKQGADRTEVMTQIDQRLKDMDAMGIDLQLIMCPPGQCYYGVPVDVAVKAAQIVNDGIAEYMARKPDRFVALGTVPMNDGKEAAKELERGMRTHGFKGVQILTNIAGKEISDPACEPFWKKAEELGAIVLLHPNGFTQAERFGKYYFTNVIGNPLDTTVALHYLIFDGVLERYPNLKIITVHGGGFLGGYSGRIDHAWGARSDARGGLPNPPTSYLKKIYFDTVVFTPHQLEALVKTFGVDKILLGTDYPFDMAEYDPIGHVNGDDSLDATAREKIIGGNAKKLLGL